MHISASHLPDRLPQTTAWSSLHSSATHSPGFSSIRKQIQTAVQVTRPELHVLTPYHFLSRNMACSISLPRASGDIATYVDPFQTSVFEPHPSEPSRPYSPCNGCPREVDSPATSPANSRRSSPSSNPPFLQTEQRRGSYSCVKEDDCGTCRFCCFPPPELTQAEFFTHHMLTCSVTTGIAQSFLVSRPSTLHLANIVQAPRSQAELQTPNETAQQDMQTSTICCSCGGVQGWQYTQSFVKRKSKSYVDLRLLAGSLRRDGLQDWEWAKRPKLQEVVPARIEEHQVSPPGHSPLERLPTEILGERDGYYGLATGMLTRSRPDHYSAST